jgi:hypothetical protein
MREPEDQQGGFDTSAELRRDIPATSTLPPLPPMHTAARRSVWRRWGVALIAAVVVGIIIYFVVASL